MALTLANSVNDMRLTINDLIDDVANLQFLSIGDIPDVNIDSITNNTVLVYNSDDAIFEPVSFNLVAGSNTQIQFNSDGSLGADANLVFDLDSATLTVPNANVTQLDASNVVTEDIQSNTVVATDVQSSSANVDSLTANTVEVTSGNVDSLTVNTLEVTTGNVESLTVNSISYSNGIEIIGIEATPRIYTITVESTEDGNNFYVNGERQDELTLVKGRTYIFDQSDATNSTHFLRLSETEYGTHGGGTEYTDGVTITGTAGTDGQLEIVVDDNTPAELYYYCSVHSGMGSVISVVEESSSRTFQVVVQNVGGSNYYFIDGVQQRSLTLFRGVTYTFDLSDASLSGHPLRLSETDNGTHGGGTEYTDGVTITGTAGTDGQLEIVVDDNTPDILYYYCTNHSGMGGKIEVDFQGLVFGNVVNQSGTTVTNITIGGNLIANSVSLTSNLDVVGDTNLESNLSISGELTSVNNVTSTGTICANNFIGDGSNLSGIQTDCLSNVQQILFDTDALLTLPSGNTAQRPIGVSTGTIRFNTDVGLPEIAIGSRFFNIALDIQFVDVTPALATTVAGDLVTRPLVDVEYLVVAGGGGGDGDNLGGGGGAGGYRTNHPSFSCSGCKSSLESSRQIALKSPLLVTVGAGGGHSSNGSDSTFDEIQSCGGGAGGKQNHSASSGGSGGGGGGQHGTGPGGCGTDCQGFPGGGRNPSNGGGGGGGACQSGSCASGYRGGRGGCGIKSCIGGYCRIRAGGGSGNKCQNAIPGGGACASSGNATRCHGCAEYGGGGSGNYYGAGGNGGSGVVILEVSDTLCACVGSGLTAYNYTCNGKRVVCAIDGSDSICFFNPNFE